VFSDRILTQTLEIALSGGGDFADIFIEEERTTNISCEENRIERVISGIDRGACVRVISGRRTKCAYTSDLTEESLLNVSKSIRVEGESAPSQARKVDLKPISSDIELKVQKDFQSYPIDSKAELVNRANSSARSVDKRIRQVNVGYSDRRQKVMIANSEGLLIEDERMDLLFRVRAIAADEGIIQTGHEVRGGFIGFELFDEYSPEDIARQAARRAILMLLASKSPAGRMTVVLSGEAGGTMIHEAIGHSLEADLVQKGMSKYAGKVGESVASDLITVIDDATLPKRRGSFRFDDEGAPGQRTVLVDKGVLKGYLYDRYTAKIEGMLCEMSRVDLILSGNGRRESYHHKPIVRMSNTFIAPDKTDPRKIIKATPKGLFVKRVGGGEVNTLTGDFVFEVNEGYLIEDGRIGKPVRGATLIGNGPQILKEIDMLGNDLSFDVGSCGKDGQVVPVTSGQPTLRIPEIVVGGELT